VNIGLLEFSKVLIILQFGFYFSYMILLFYTKVYEIKAFVLFSYFNEIMNLTKIFKTSCLFTNRSFEIIRSKNNLKQENHYNYMK